MSKQVKYTRVSLDKLVQEAINLHIDVDFTIRRDGQYVIKHSVLTTVPGQPGLASKSENVHLPESCAMAHWFIMGLIAQHKNQINSYFPISR